MELRHLRYFVAVAEERSLGRAAHRLHVSQPALSKQISELENELELKLFTRNSRGVQLTEAGRVFLLGGRRALMAAKLATEQAQEAAKGQRGRLVIATHCEGSLAFLPGVFSRFREQHPLVEITPLHLNNRAQVEAVLNGSIMLGIGYYSAALQADEEEQVCTRLLDRSPVAILCPKNRRFPKQAPARLEDFRDEHFLSVDPAYAFGFDEWLRGFCKSIGGFEPDISASANALESLIGMVAAGRGVFLGPELTIRGSEEIWRSVADCYRLTEPGSHFELFAIWKKQSQMEPLISKFIDLLGAELKSA
jgi:DNA-binding transcriptional LysR family regulator